MELRAVRGRPVSETPSGPAASYTVIVLADDGLSAELRAVLDRVAAATTPPVPSRLSPVPPASPIDRLTDREREVLCLMAEGSSNAEIAQRLFLSSTTVKCHVGRVLQKLHARDRVQAVVAAFRSGLAPCD